MLELSDQGLYNNRLKKQDDEQPQVLLKQTKIEKNFNTGVIKRTRQGTEK